MNERIWIYLSDKEFSEEMQKNISADCVDFINDWNTHGNPLNGSFETRHHRFIIIKVNEALFSASGCSIDKQLQFVKFLESKYNIHLLNRLLVAYRDGDTIITKSSGEIKQALKNGSLSPDTIYFDVSVSTLKQLESSFESSMRNSWLMPKVVV